VAIDEIQFFEKNIIEVVLELQMKEKNVIFAGLDLDFKREPFGMMPELILLQMNLKNVIRFVQNAGLQLIIHKD